MSLISVSALGKSFGAVDVFGDVSFAVAQGARLAIVGPNGIGKTTLLRILVGLEEPSTGAVTRARGLKIGYLPQEADFQLRGSLWDFCLEPFSELIGRQAELERLEQAMADPLGRGDALSRYGSLQHDFEQRGGYVYPARIRQVLTGLGFSEPEYHAAIGVLSGGQRAGTAPAAVEPQLLILDEPTNHLDIQAVSG
jgi:ATP-binding cassette subfamily F protein 3